MGLTGIALYYIGFNLALTYTSASQGALVQSSIPAVTAIAAVWWLGERLSGRRLLGIGFAIGGVLMIVARAAPDTDAPAPLVGNLLMFGTVVVWGAYTVLAKRLANADPAVVTAIVSVIGTLMLVPAALIEAADTPITPISVESWLCIIYLGALASWALSLQQPASCSIAALRDLDASRVGIFINLVPVLGVVSGVVLLGETISPIALVGGLLVLAGVWISSTASAYSSSPGKHRT